MSTGTITISWWSCRGAADTGAGELRRRVVVWVLAWGALAVAALLAWEPAAAAAVRPVPPPLPALPLAPAPELPERPERREPPAAAAREVTNGR